MAFKWEDTNSLSFWESGEKEVPSFGSWANPNDGTLDGYLPSFSASSGRWLIKRVRESNHIKLDSSTEADWTGIIVNDFFKKMKFELVRFDKTDKSKGSYLAAMNLVELRNPKFAGCKIIKWNVKLEVEGSVLKAFVSEQEWEHRDRGIYRASYKWPPTG